MSRFECEIDNYGSMENVLAKLDMKTVKLAGFTELLKVRAAEAKMPYPTRSELTLSSSFHLFTSFLLLSLLLFSLHLYSSLSSTF